MKRNRCSLLHQTLFGRRLCEAFCPPNKVGMTVSTHLFRTQQNLNLQEETIISYIVLNMKKYPQGDIAKVALENERQEGYVRIGKETIDASRTKNNYHIVSRLCGVYRPKDQASGRETESQRRRDQNGIVRDDVGQRLLRRYAAASRTCFLYRLRELRQEEIRRRKHHLRRCPQGRNNAAPAYQLRTDHLRQPIEC